jgi:glycosyltransferase involved in cell wall biosynthesis
MVVTMNPLVSVIIPTCADLSRAPLLWRAIGTLLSNQDGLVLPVVAVNGSCFLPEVLNRLRQRRDIRCIYVEEPSTTKARLAARRVIDTEYFGMLDDDDEYLPGAAKLQTGPLLSDPSIDVVVTNGYRSENHQDVLNFEEFSTFQKDPLRSLMDSAWLNSGGFMCRTETVSSDYFEVPRSMELTYAAMKLALSRQLLFLDIPTYRWHRDTPSAQSRSKYYMEGAPDAIRRMLALNPPAQIRRRLQRKYVASLHFLSDWERAEGNYRAAWRYHLRSLLSIYGVKYFSYTRHLLQLGQELQPLQPPEDQMPH